MRLFPDRQMGSTAILVEEDVKELPKTGKSVGVDLGLLDFAALSNRNKIPNPHFSKPFERRLRREKRKLSRRIVKAKTLVQKDPNKNWRDCSNLEKQRLKVAKLYAKVNNRKTDFLHKRSTELVKSHDLLVVEDLPVKRLVKNHHLAKSIHDVSWSRFTDMLKYKSKWYGKAFIKIDRFFASSQICSACGHKDGKKALAIREWDCPQCGTHHDRDINAAINILNEGRKRVAASKT
ncbi:transposase [Sporolactobacillus terrae]|uniref:Transposase n=1 Tax=Sporolactobacillus terrae TaxID=269673 RepID=A0A5K7WYH2_9BACL|nr:transposase [Sporolactobacillus terrae]BBN99711.1 hypothetical protein St703_24160 [Sporolactobacillus terrae]